MDIITIGILLEYLYKKFVVTFILCLIGAFIKETMNTVRLNKLNATRLLASTVLAAALMCALIDYVKIPFSIYAVISIVSGIWAPTLLKLILNITFMKTLIKNIFKNIKDPVAKGLSNTIEELDNNNQESDDENSSE